MNRNARENVTIVAGLTAVLLSLRSGAVAICGYFAGYSSVAWVVGGISATAGLMLPLPLVVYGLQRTAPALTWRRGLVQIAAAFAYAVVASVIVVFCGIVVVMPPPPLTMWVTSGIVVMAPVALLVYATAFGVVRSRQWYESAAEAEAARRAAESVEVERTRAAIEERLRPRFLIESLEQIAAANDPAEAEVRLHRLARHVRALLRRRAAAPPATVALPQRPAIPAPAVSAMFYGTLLTYAVTVTLADLRYLEWANSVSYAAMRLFGALAWLFVGPLLGAATMRIALLRFPIAVALATGAAVLASVAVTAIMLVALALLFGDPLLPTVATIVTDPHVTTQVTRNSFIGLALAALALAFSSARAILEAQVATALLQNDVTRAEMRELEERFHPHFLLNALTSIAALISTAPDVAATMCRRLATLVAKTVSSAGVSRWPLRDELELIGEYMAVQQMRFGERLRLEAWEIDPAARDALIPRLLLQPLIENAVKHGVARLSRPTAISLVVKKRRRALQIVVRNDTAAGAEIGVLGGGLTFVLRRIAAASGDFDFERNLPGRFTVRCRIPFRRV